MNICNSTHYAQKLSPIPIAVTVHSAEAQKCTFIMKHEFSDLSLFIHSFIHQWLYNPLLGPGLVFSFLFFYRDGRLLWRVTSPSHGRYQHTEQHKHRYLCLEWDSKPWFQCSSMRRQFIPLTAESLWSASFMAVREICIRPNKTNQLRDCP
jgi:hypothetical protein